MNLRSLFPAVSLEERPRILYATAAFMCVASAGVVARTAGSAMFLSHFESSALSYMYLGSAAILMVISFGFGSLMGRIPLVRLLVITGAVLVAMAVGLRLALFSHWRGVSAIVYFFSDVVGRIPSLLFWSSAAAMFNAREAKRLFIFVGAGGTAACVVIGALIGPFSARLGTENLLLVVALQIAGFAAIVARWVGRQEPAKGAPVRQVRASAGIRYYTDLVALPQVRHVVGLVTMSAVALLLTDFLFKAGAKAHFAGPKLAGFFGMFYSATSFTALLVQLFLVHQVLRRGGVFVASVVLPATLLVLSLGIALTGGFGWILAAKFADPVFDFTLNAAALQLLYLAVRKQSRSQARTFIEGFARPATNALVAVFLVLVARTAPPRVIATIIACAAALWLYEAWRAYGSYVAGLVDSIGVRRFDPSDEASIGDRLVETHVRVALRSSSDDQVLYLLGVVSQLGEFDWRSEFRELLGRERPEIKVAAIDYLSVHGSREDARWIVPCTEHPDPSVRCAAIHALAKIARDEALEPAMRCLSDPDVEVRAAATSELINVGDLDALLAACISLKEMLRSDEEPARVAATSALATVNHAGMTRILGDLLADPYPAVRRAALRACMVRPDPALIPAVLGLLGDPDLASEACDTLGAFGTQVLEHLRSFPDDARRGGGESLQFVPRVLAGTKSGAALPLLAGAMDIPSVRLRGEVVSACCDLLRVLPAGQWQRSEVVSAALRQLADSEGRREMIAKVAGIESARLLRDVLEEERASLLGNAFALVGALHPGVEMRSILWVLRSGTAESRAEALEVLDNVLDARLKGAIFAIFELSTPAGGPAAGGEHAMLDLLLREDHAELVVASAAYTSGHHGIHTSVTALRELLGSASPYIREAALDALSRLGSAGEVREAALSVMDDENPAVRQLALRLAPPRDEVNA